MLTHLTHTHLTHKDAQHCKTPEFRLLQLKMSNLSQTCWKKFTSFLQHVEFLINALKSKNISTKRKKPRLKAKNSHTSEAEVRVCLTFLPEEQLHRLMVATKLHRTKAEDPTGKESRQMGARACTHTHAHARARAHTHTHTHTLTQGFRFCAESKTMKLKHDKEEKCEKWK